MTQESTGHVTNLLDHHGKKLHLFSDCHLQATAKQKTVLQFWIGMNEKPDFDFYSDFQKFGVDRFVKHFFF